MPDALAHFIIGKGYPFNMSLRMRGRPAWVSSMAVSVDVEYISVGCNQTPHCLDWNAINGVLAYGAENSIALAIQGRVSAYTGIFDR